MKASVLVSLIASLALPAMAQPASNPIPPATRAALAPGSVWSLNIVGLKGESLGSVTLELLDENANTCLSGEWKKTRVVRSSFPLPAMQLEKRDYFPTYKTDGQVLTVQLNPPGLCDAYDLLSGKFTEQSGKGDYDSLGLRGERSLGTFTAKREKR